ncbi:hypothetical protein M3J09_009830 [Ascochyta lentis]
MHLQSWEVLRSDTKSIALQRSTLVPSTCSRRTHVRKLQRSAGFAGLSLAFLPWSLSTFAFNASSIAL